ncbi:MAG: type IV pilin protein [Gammaproteobacteria bacterium]
MDSENGSGFSLLEVLIVLAIMGILASLTVPGYQQSVQQSRRVDAVALLLELQLSQARNFAEQGEYKTSFSALGGTRQSFSNTYYQLTFISADKDHWVVAATPAGTQATDACGVFAVDEKGAVYGGRYAVETCWNK